jgi:N-acetylglucosaminyl-diphospho-decaprenol L-rhamnosyltransferase
MQRPVNRRNLANDAALDCSIIVVHYRAEDRIRACLASLATGASDVRFETIVVDNSRSLAATGLTRQYPGMRLIENPANFGFSRAANQGVACAKGRNVLLLNPDTEVHPDAIARLARYLDAHQDTGAVGPRLLDSDGRLQLSCRRFPGLLTIFFGRYAMVTRLLPHNRFSRDYLYLEWDHASVREVDWLSGACLMVRRSVIDRVGALDERYFLFVEDMDWCRRIRNAGYLIAYLPDAVVTHDVGVSRAPGSASVVWARHRSMWLYFRKHFRSHRLHGPLVALGLGLRATAMILLAHLRPARQ